MIILRLRIIADEISREIESVLCITWAAGKKARLGSAHFVPAPMPVIGHQEHFRVFQNRIGLGCGELISPDCDRSP